ncbi:MAG: dTDP-4-dehydrorhamnose reductase [Chloroflexi bacterium]|nr:dTDP-4-dehydrorhamnose reductase [Chloroflexota bacterium]
MRILVTGGQGQLGVALQRALSEHEVRALGHADLDVTSAAAVSEAIESFHPEVVIHAAAWTDTAAAERDPAAALAVNGEGSGNVARACAAAGVPMAYVSSNEVFDGEKGAPYDEDDPTQAINEYGRGKLAGEEAVRKAGGDFYIIRTSWLYGPGRTSFPEKIIERAQADGALRGVTDEIASPTWTGDLAPALSTLVSTRRFGLYHLAGEGGCSRKEWAEEVMRLSGIGLPVKPALQADFDLPYRKPVDSTLANHRAAALGITLRPWREALAEHMRTPQITELIAARAGQR